MALAIAAIATLSSCSTPEPGAISHTVSNTAVCSAFRKSSPNGAQQLLNVEAAIRLGMKASDPGLRAVAQTVNTDLADAETRAWIVAGTAAHLPGAPQHLPTDSRTRQLVATSQELPAICHRLHA